ncbi:putative Zinc finger protein [Zostera marina]|uniref:Putative Zinc finger protein n=1 Tax=Zostera marina TaxID=29655 RepID=A0A0K9PDA3_ZOSMR|nr:putative Zinc finger protein [Zostera marina]
MEPETSDSDYSELLEDEQENEGSFEGVTSISCPSMEQKDSKRDDVKRDIRKYYCEYCGICRSKKTLITAHVLLNHKEEIQDKKDNDAKGENVNGSSERCYACVECSAVFNKPAYLQQHMQGHSIERPFSCPLDDCHHSYRRKDHLSRHVLSHKGKLFKCSVKNCNQQFAFQTNMKRHIDEFHSEGEIQLHYDKMHEKLHTCSESGCRKTFKYLSKLKKHENSHKVICNEAGCMKSFINNKYLKEHMYSCHRFKMCHICGTQQLKKNFKRHKRIHELSSPTTEMLNSTFKDCCHKFSKKSNLNKHIKSVHLNEKPFTCHFTGCEKKFSFKHVRDNHEKSGIHVHVPNDFLVSDEEFRQRERGGRRHQKYPDVATLFQKRVTAPCGRTSILDDPGGYLRWLLDDEET